MFCRIRHLNGYNSANMPDIDKIPPDFYLESEQ